MNNQAVNILETESTTVTMACKIPTAFLILVLSFSSEMHAWQSKFSIPPSFLDSQS